MKKSRLKLTASFPYKINKKINKKPTLGTRPYYIRTNKD